MADLGKDEILYFIKEMEVRIDEVKMWVKHHYSNYQAENQSVLGYRSMELDKQLRIYHDAMSRKDMMIKMLEEVNE